MPAHFRRPLDVAMVDGDIPAGGDLPTLYLARLPNGPLVVLDGSAALIWRAAVTTGAGAAADPEESVVVEVAALSGVEPTDIRNDVRAFVTQLLDQGLLERA